MMLRRMLAVLTATIVAGLGMGGCQSQSRLFESQPVAGLLTVEQTIPPGKWARFDLLALRSDRKAIAPVSIVVAGNADRRSARVALEISTEMIIVDGVEIQFQLVSLRLLKGFAFASIDEPVVTFAAAPVAGMHVQDDPGQPEGEMVTTFFPVIWIGDLEAGAPGTKLIVQATEPADRRPQGDEDIRLILVKGNSGMTSRLRQELPEKHETDALTGYWAFESKELPGNGGIGEVSKGRRPRGEKVNEFVARAVKIATEAGVP